MSEPNFYRTDEGTVWPSAEAAAAVIERHHHADPPDYDASGVAAAYFHLIAHPAGAEALRSLRRAHQAAMRPTCADWRRGMKWEDLTDQEKAWGAWWAYAYAEAGSAEEESLLELRGSLPPLRYPTPQSRAEIRAAALDHIRTASPVSIHGPCSDGGAPVRDSLPQCPDHIRAWLLSRLDAGEEKYGAPLLVGWSRSDEALAEELADAINYAVAGGRSQEADSLMQMLVDLRAARCDASGLEALAAWEHNR